MKQQLETQKSQRCNYLYLQAELIPWQERIEAIDREAVTTFVVTNNHFVGQAVANAKMLQGMFDEPRRGEETDHLRQLVQLSMEIERGRPWVTTATDSETE